MFYFQSCVFKQFTDNDILINYKMFWFVLFVVWLDYVTLVFILTSVSVDATFSVSSAAEEIMYSPILVIHD